MEKTSLSAPAFPSWADFPDIELYMDQVIGILEKHLSPYFPEEKCITPTMINNYVKQKLVPPPQNKRYTKGQITHLFMICILKSFMQLSDISALLQHLSLDRTEEEVYTLFCQMAQKAAENPTGEKSLSATPKDLSEKALFGALAAFASILYARFLFRNAAKTWPVKEESEEKETKKEKKEAKKEKEKEKKKKNS